jgi:hypothetical protein
MVEVAGQLQPASALAQQCVKEWERILTEENLPIDRMGT